MATQNHVGLHIAVTFVIAVCEFVIIFHVITGWVTSFYGNKIAPTPHGLSISLSR